MTPSGVVDKHFYCSQKGYTPDTKLDLYLERCPGRQSLENYISSKYQQVHNAQIREYLPILAGIRGMEGFLGAFGLRPGQYRPMFLEQYLDSPVEQQIAVFSKKPVDRCTLMEIGNLAITRKGYGPIVMVIMAKALAEAGYEWMVFTVTEQVERLMKRLGFEPHDLASADPDCLAGDKSLWGSYYENNPRVMVGNLKEARQLIEDSGRLRELANQQRMNISNMANSLRDYRRLRGA